MCVCSCSGGHQLCEWVCHSTRGNHPPPLTQFLLCNKEEWHLISRNVSVRSRSGTREIVVCVFFFVCVPVCFLCLFRRIFCTPSHRARKDWTTLCLKSHCSGNFAKCFADAGKARDFSLIRARCGRLRVKIQCGFVCLCAETFVHIVCTFRRI